MLSSTYRKKFISLDLETTHLDMREGKIMEVGAVAIELIWDEKEQKVKCTFGKSYATLVNPEIPVSETALMLTGIKEDELKSAPPWHKAKKQFQNFLGEESLVGHNLGFDLDYLAQQGLKLKNSRVDTLEVALTLLPLGDSHALEYLAESFAVVRSQAHRSLPDSEHAALILASLLNEFLTFDQKVQDQIRELLGRSSLSFRELVLDLPKIQIRKDKNFDLSPSTSLVSAGLRPSPSPVEEVLGLNWPDKTIVQVSLSFQEEQESLERLAKVKHAGLVALASEVYLDKIPVLQKVASPALALCQERHQALLQTDNLSDLLVKILIKIVILNGFEPQAVDLSRIKWTPEERRLLPCLSVAPELCRHHSCGYFKTLKLKKNQVYFLKLGTLFELILKWSLSFSDRNTLLFDLAAIEDQLSEAVLQTWSLRKIRDLIARVYPIDSGFPSLYPVSPKPIEELANELDLFFGVLHLIYRAKENRFAENIVVDENESDETRFTKLFHPAEKLERKIETVVSDLLSQIQVAGEVEAVAELKNLHSQLEELLKFLKDFFLERQEEFIYWLEFDRETVSLNQLPKNLSPVWQDFTRSLASVSIVDKKLPKVSFPYFQKRLGLENFQHRLLATPQPAKTKLTIFPKNLLLPDLVALVQDLPGRSLVILPNQAKLQEVYLYLAKMKPGKEILADKFSGNLRVLKTKFFAAGATDVILLLTTHAVLRYWPTFPPLKNLLILRLPFEASGSRPALLGLAEQRSFVDHILPRGVHLLYRILSRFHGSGGKNQEIFILDPRILTDYDQAFLTYLEEYPEYEISTDKNR